MATTKQKGELRDQQALAWLTVDEMTRVRRAAKADMRSVSDWLRLKVRAALGMDDTTTAPAPAPGLRRRRS